MSDAPVDPQTLLARVRAARRSLADVEASLLRADSRPAPGDADSPPTLDLPLVEDPPGPDPASDQGSPGLDLSPRVRRLTAQPFDSFSDLSEFLEALCGLPGVAAVRSRRLEAGALEVEIEAGAAVPLADLLAAELTASLPLEFELQEEGDDLHLQLQGRRHAS